MAFSAENGCNYGREPEIDRLGHCKFISRFQILQQFKGLNEVGLLVFQSLRKSTWSVFTQAPNLIMHCSKLVVCHKIHCFVQFIGWNSRLLLRSFFFFYCCFCLLICITFAPCPITIHTWEIVLLFVHFHCTIRNLNILALYVQSHN